MQLAQIRAFLAVAELESFSLAAERLHVTQPAVSKRIRQLEQRPFGAHDFSSHHFTLRDHARQRRVDGDEVVGGQARRQLGP